MYPKCGCPMECRVCNTLAARKNSQKNLTGAVLTFKAGITPAQVEGMVKALGKDAILTAQVQEFDPLKAVPVWSVQKPSIQATSLPWKQAAKEIQDGKAKDHQQAGATTGDTGSITGRQDPDAPLKAKTAWTA